MRATVSTQLEKVFLYPANIQVAKTPMMISTLLGTCVAVCLWDSKTKIGGMNHYLLPLWNGEGLASPKYGNIAIPKLVDNLVELGANRKNLIAKVFGGRMQKQGASMASTIGQRNVDIARQALAELRIPIVAENVAGPNGVNIYFDTDSGKVMLRYIKGGIK